MIEGLIAFALLVALASLLQPSLSKLREHSFTQGCQSNLQQIHNAIVLYQHDYDFIYPGPSWIGQAPIYYRPNRRNKWITNTARYLRNYLETGVNAVGNHYVKQYICPQNADLDLNGIPENRLQYRGFHLRRIGKPFGYPKRRDTNTTLPLSFYAIKRPSSSQILTDGDRKNCSWAKTGTAPDEPSHENRSRNYLFADGKIELIEIPKK